MSKKIKKAITISVIVIVIILAIISTFFIVKYFIKKSKVDYVCEVYSDETIQDKLKDITNNNNNNQETIDNLTVQVNNENVIRCY